MASGATTLALRARNRASFFCEQDAVSRLVEMLPIMSVWPSAARAISPIAMIPERRALFAQYACCRNVCRNARNTARATTSVSRRAHTVR